MFRTAALQLHRDLTSASLKKYHVGQLLSVHPLIFAPRNLKLGDKVMKQDKDLAFQPECENEDDLLLTAYLGKPLVPSCRA